eukprot:1160766-Pelagomonas_calceolata.AAC.19
MHTEHMCMHHRVKASGLFGDASVSSSVALVEAPLLLAAINEILAHTGVCTSRHGFGRGAAAAGSHQWDLGTYRCVHKHAWIWWGRPCRWQT